VRPVDDGHGVAAFWLFGLMLQSCPRWLGATPVRYARFGLIFFHLCGAQLSFYLGIVWSGRPGPCYLLPLLGAWALTLASLRDMRMLAYWDSLRLRGLRLMLPLTAAGLLVPPAGRWFEGTGLIGFGLRFAAVLQLLLMSLIITDWPGRRGSA